MKYQVEISAVAEGEAESAFRQIAENISIGKAKYWYAGLLDAIADLQNAPKRSKTIVNRQTLVEYRKVLYGHHNNLYQILFAIVEDTDFPTVCVLHIQPDGSL